MKSGFAHYQEYIDQLNEQILKNMLEMSRASFGVAPKCEHSFVNTGMRKSWCSKCNCNALFVDGQYQETEEC